MGTIVKFKPDGDYYYSRGLSYYESDNFLDALKNYREAYKFVEKSGDEIFRAIIEVEMACCYRSLGLFRESQLMYYKALSANDGDTSFDSILGLIDILGSSGSEDALAYYMHTAIRRGFSRDLDYMEVAAQFYDKRDYKVEPPPEQNVLELGKKLLCAGQYEFASQLLELIPPEAETYGEARVKLAALNNSRGMHEKALRYLAEANGCEREVEKLINEIMAYYKLNKSDEFTSAVEELKFIETDSVIDLAQIVHVSAIVGERDLVLKFGKTLYAISPQKGAMLCYAIALSNSGYLRDARKVMVDLLALYPFDAAVRVYSYLISSSGEATDFPLTGDIPAEVERKILDKLNGTLELCGADKLTLKSRLKEDDMQTPVLMVLQAGSEKSKSLLSDVIADIPYFERYIRDCLMDPAYPEEDKRMLLQAAVKKFKKRPIYFTARDICKPVYCRPPAKSGAWREAYCLAASSLAAFGLSGFEDDLDAAFDDLKAAIGGPHPSIPALAALMANRVGRVAALEDDECCIELFDANKKIYFDYKNRVSTTE